MSFYPFTEENLRTLTSSAAISDYLNLQITELTQEQITTAFDDQISPDLIQLSIVKETTPHFLVNGNKWHKLKFNLLDAVNKQCSTIGTFGGGYSNHLVALAEVSNRLGINCVGVIRGEAPKTLSPTLKDAADLGMRLHFVTRKEYKNRYEESFCCQLSETLELDALIPEGGNNLLGVLGCHHWGHLIDQVIDESEITTNFDYWLTAVGTGASLAGLSSYCATGYDKVEVGLPKPKNVIGIAVLKQADYLNGEVKQWHAQLSTQPFDNWQLYTEAHGGGYGKWNAETVNFIQRFFQTTGIQLDQIYTAKLLQALPQLLADGVIKPGQRLLIIHSGGMQGIRSVPELLR